MAFMDFLPQFSDNTGQSVDDPTLAAINLKRKLALADSLKNSPVLEGQMVSGHYVKPSWTQSLANAVNKGLGAYTEHQAMKEYGDLQKTKSAQLGEVLRSTKPHEEDFPLDTVQSGGAPGMWETKMVQPDMEKTIELLNKYDPSAGVRIAEARINKYLSPESNLGKVEIDKFTPQSIAAYQKTGDYSSLVPVTKASSKYTNIQQDKAGNTFGYNTETQKIEMIPGERMATENWSAPYKVGGEYLQRNANTGEIRKAYGTAEGDKAPAGYVWSADANGNKTLTAIAGGPADKTLNPTTDQANANLYANRMEKADKILNTLEGKYSPMAISVKTSGKTALIPGGQAAVNAYMSQNDQKAEQAQRDFINAVLRRESGAAISQSEFDNANQQYFPQPNDGPEIIKQKAELRKTAIEGIKQGAGSLNKPSSKVVDFKDL